VSWGATKGEKKAELNDRRKETNIRGRSDHLFGGREHDLVPECQEKGKEKKRHKLNELETPRAANKLKKKNRKKKTGLREQRGNQANQTTQKRVSKKKCIASRGRRGEVSIKERTQVQRFWGGGGEGQSAVVGKTWGHADEAGLAETRIKEVKTKGKNHAVGAREHIKKQQLERKRNEKVRVTDKNNQISKGNVTTEKKNQKRKEKKKKKNQKGVFGKGEREKCRKR